LVSTTFDDLDAVLARAPLVRQVRIKRLYEFSDGGTIWIIKVYPRSGVLARLKNFVRGTRARREFDASREVARRGVPCVEVEASAEWKGGSAVFVRKLEEWKTLEEKLREGSDAGLLVRYGRFARTVHDANVWQDDFNPTNILVGPAGEMRLIDYERLEPRRSISERERLRLLAKLVRMPTIGRVGLVRVLEGYLRPGEELLDRILSLADRQRRIDRAKLAKKCLRENRTFARIETETNVGWFLKSALTVEEARTLPEGFQAVPAKDAFQEWREANLRALDGGEVPVAVVRRRGRKCGFVMFRKG